MEEKSYRKATEKEIKRGAKKTTDELSKAEAMKYFSKRSKNTGAKQFRWRGDVYDLEGNKVGGTKKDAGKKSSAPEKSPRPVPRSRAVGNIETTKLPPLRDSEYKSSGRGDGRAERVRRMADAALARTEASGKKKDVTYSDWKEMTRTERKAAGLPVSSLGGAMRMPGGPLSLMGGRSDPRASRSRTQNMAKGGLVKTNCGASMKPDGKRKK